MKESGIKGTVCIDLETIKILKDKPEEIIDILDMELKGLRSALAKEIMKYLSKLNVNL